MKRWWILKDRLRHGPFSEAEIRNLVESGLYRVDDFVLSEDRQDISTLAHQTIQDVLGKFETGAISAPSTAESKLIVDRRNHETRPEDADTMPKIRELLAKIEAVELVDSAGRSEDSGIRYEPVQHSGPESFSDSFSSLFKRALPVVTVIGLVVVGVGYLNDQGFFDSSDIKAKSETLNRSPANKDIQAPAPVTARPVAGPTQVSVPKLSERSVSGFERKAPVRQVQERRLQEEVTEPDDLESGRNIDESPPDRSIAGRRERLRKLRRSMAPETAANPDDEPLEGVAYDNDFSEQGDYDSDRSRSRGISSQEGQDDYEQEEPPMVDDDNDPYEDPQDDVDEGLDVEYQE
jgi:hypothetical protein